MKKHLRLFLLGTAVLLAIQGVLSATTHAVAASDWQAGNIIDDSIFTNKSAMTVSQIQSWLDARLKNCDYYGAQISELGGGKDYNGDGKVTRAEFGRTYGNPAPFTCLNNYYEVPKTKPSSTIPKSNYGSSTIPTGAKSAARLIYDAAQAYSISPKVLLVKLGTESAGPLTSDTWPFKKQYLYAMGAHCPDSGPGGAANCDANYAGFSLQMREAAALLRWYLNSMDESWWSYKKPYKTNYILWNVEPSGCGGGNVYIENRATAALYTYTPYQPNSAALKNMYGTGNSCSAYGNRNFWRVFNDWFGTTHKVLFVNLSDPRYFEVANEVQKIDVTTGKAVGAVVDTGSEIKFTTKTTFDYKDCLRTQVDTERGVPYCISIDALKEVTLEFTPIDGAMSSMSLNAAASKSDIRRGQTIGETLDLYRQLDIAAKTTLAGTTYFVTKKDYEEGNGYGFKQSQLQSSIPFSSTEKTYMVTTKDTNKVVPLTQQVVAPISEDKVLATSSYATVGNTTYHRLDQDKASLLDLGIPESALEELTIAEFSSPRWMKVRSDTHKYDLLTAKQTGGVLESEREVFFNSKITLAGITYYRSTADTTNDTVKVIRSTALGASLLNEFVDFSSPRTMQLKVNTRKMDLYSKQPHGIELSKGTKIFFNSKISLNGITYFRSSYDTKTNTVYSIRASNVRSL